MDPTLADAFDADADESDDEDDDRQRLVRGNSVPVSRASSQSNTTEVRPVDSTSQPRPPRAQPSGASRSLFRFWGGGTQNEGVFSNLMAKPERQSEEKEEQPPVRCRCTSTKSHC